MAAARGIDDILPTTAAPAVALAAVGRVQRHERSFGGFWLSPTPPTRSDEGSSRVNHALLAENARSTELPPIFYCHTAVLPQTNHLQNEHKHSKIDLADDKEEAQKNPVEKSPVEKGCFRLTESDCIIIGLTPTASSKSTITIKSTRLSIRRRPTSIESKQKSSRKGPFSTDGIRLYKKWP